MSRYQTKVRPVGVWTLGANLQANTETKIDIGNLIPPMIDVGRKSILTRLTFKIQATITTNGSSPAVAHRYFRYVLDKRLVGPANFVYADQRGWHDYHYTNAARGFVDEIRALDIPASTASATRTWTQSIELEEPRAMYPLFRCPVVETFKASNAGLYLTLRTAATIKGTAITVTAATVTIYAHVLDVAMNAVIVPTFVTRAAFGTNAGEIAPSPGPGQYLRILMVNSPVPADNLDGTSSDDLAAYTTIDSFGQVGRYAVYQEAVERLLDRQNRAVSKESPSPNASPTNNSSLFRPWDPVGNSDGLTTAIPLVVPNVGGNYVREAPVWEDFPRLHANGDSRTGLPGGFFWLIERIDARTAPLLSAYVGAITDRNGKSILGRTAKAADAGDVSRAPLTIDAS